MTPRSGAIAAILSLMLLSSGCAREHTASIPAAPRQPAAAVPGSPPSADDGQEPLAPGIKPLTVEQEEQIAQ